MDALWYVKISDLRRALGVDMIASKKICTKPLLHNFVNMETILYQRKILRRCKKSIFMS